MKAERDTKRRVARGTIEKRWEGRIIYQSRNLISLKAKSYATMKKTRRNAMPQSAVQPKLREIPRSLNKRSV